MNTTRELPKYQCHKKVWALKIKSILFDKKEQLSGVSGEVGRMAEITPYEDGYAPFIVDENYIAKHNPKEGGYYVVYDDGYKSFTPADAFESGYALIK